MQCRRVRPRLASLLSLFLLTTLTIPGRAQEQEVPPPIPPPAGQTGQGEAQPEITPDGKPANPFGPENRFSLVRSPGFVTRQPYASWKQHSGAAEESIVLVRLGAAEEPAVTGLVMRCDGFLLVPSTVVDAHRAGTALTVAVTGAENEELTAPVSIAGRIHHTSPRCPLGVLKVNDHHLRCLSLLDSRVVKPGVPVRLVTAVPGDKPGRCRAVSSDGIVGVQTAGVTGKEGEVAYVLDATKGDTPVGAVVVDRESGAALGMVTRGGTKAIFTTFATLYEICNEVGLTPDREAIKERKGGGSRPPQVTSTLASRFTGEKEMVLVEGGPVQLHGKQGDYYRRTFKTDIACMPDFFMDAHLTTREEYEVWAKKSNSPVIRKFVAVPAQYPSEDPKAAFIRRSPVSIELPWHAANYAASHGKRLPTEVEWRRATLCDSLGWAVGLVEMTEGQIRTLYGMVQQRKAAWWEWLFRPRVVTSANAPRPRNAPRGMPPGTGPNGMTSEEVMGVLRTVAPMDREHIGRMGTFVNGITYTVPESYPWIIVPVGSRVSDKSIFGVHDVVMNIPEHVLAVAKGTQVAPKIFPAKVNAMESGVLAGYGYRGPGRVGGGHLSVGVLEFLYGDGDSRLAQFFSQSRGLAESPATVEQISLGLTIYCLFAARGLEIADLWFAIDETVARTFLLQMNMSTKVHIDVGFRGAR
jgi:formylglycine-generating enzyme required for sulfatase activity